ncbi:MAG: CRTAC1 family protein [Planctomycetota bacterium]
MIYCFRVCFAASVCLLTVSGCQKSEPDPGPLAVPEAAKTEFDRSDSPFRFNDQTAAANIKFSYRNGEEAGHFAILESLGGGVGVIDIDHDGVEDLFLPGGGELSENVVPRGVPSGCFRNRGRFRFDDVSVLSGGGSSRYYSHGAAVTDFNNDGFSDLVVTGYGGLQLFLNLGDGTFSEIASEAGLLDMKWSSSAAWGDLNGDGCSDLYVAHYVDWSPENHPFCKSQDPGQREICPPRQYRGLDDAFYLSNGDGSFTDASESVGLSDEGKGLGVCLADLDEDGDVDVYVTNDTVENFLYENNSGHLEDVSLLSGTSVSERGVPEGSMGVDVFDYNRDGKSDIWVVNYENESAALYESSGKLQFRHVSQRTGVTAAGGGLFVGWGTCAFDADLNGFEDIFISNGHVIRFPVNAPVLQKPLLLQNLEGARFRNVAPTTGDYFTTDHPGRGAVTVDLNQDGLLDLVVSNNNAPAAVLKNESEPVGHWLQAELIGTVSARNPIGAVVTIRVGETELKRHLKGGGSYASTSSPRLHFGLPRNVIPDSLTVRWPSGIVQTIHAPQTGAIVPVVETSPVER